MDVAELMPPLIEWNRTFLVEYNGPLLEDLRTRVIQGDLFDTLSNTPKGTYDALLLDIDNTPDDLITEGNERLYTASFLNKIQQVLTPGGSVSYWLSEPAPKFKKQLEKAGLRWRPMPQSLIRSQSGHGIASTCALPVAGSPRSGFGRLGFTLY